MKGQAPPVTTTSELSVTYGGGGYLITKAHKIFVSTSSDL
jgi:hypothetical protein